MSGLPKSGHDWARFAGLDAWYYWANGAAVLLVISLQKPEAMQARMASA